MTHRDSIRPNQVVLLERAADKAQLLGMLGERAAAALGLEAARVTAALLRREELGSTGLGGGIAIPHTRIAGLEKPFSVLAVLRTPLSFDAIDGAPVDIVFVLLAPDTAEALKALAGISRTLREPAVLTALRHAPSAQAAYDILDP